MKEIDYALMYVTDDRVTEDTAFYRILEESLKGGATIIQLREKTMDSRRFYERAVKTKSLCDQYGVPLIINDRLDIALAVDATGLHLGQKDLPADIARKLLGQGRIIGLSVGDTRQAAESNHLPVDYLGVSPVFGTQTKTLDLDPPLGPEGLQKIRNLSERPLVSIGGIKESNAADVIRHGSDGIAVISAISGSDNPQKATQLLKQLVCQTGTKK